MNTVKALSLGMAILLASAVQADELRDEMLRCAELRDKEVRLACYDALARVSASREAEAAAGNGPAAAAPEAPSAAGSAEPAPASQRTLAERAFGMLPGGGPDHKIESRVVGEIDGLRQGLRFTLENGQVWRQTDRTQQNYHATNPKVEIKEGFMNSYRMRLEGLNARIRVRRVK